jgi:hypothetical protein
MQTYPYNLDSEFFISWSPGSGGAVIGKTISAYVHIENQSFSSEAEGKFQSNLVQIILGYYSNKESGPLQRENNCKNGLGHLKSYPEPLSQKRSYLRENCTFKFLHIMVPGGREGPQ